MDHAKFRVNKKINHNEDTNYTHHCSKEYLLFWKLSQSQYDYEQSGTNVSSSTYITDLM